MPIWPCELPVRREVCDLSNRDSQSLPRPSPRPAREYPFLRHSAAASEPRKCWRNSGRALGHPRLAIRQCQSKGVQHHEFVARTSSVAPHIQPFLKVVSAKCPARVGIATFSTAYANGKVTRTSLLFMCSPCSTRQLFGSALNNSSPEAGQKGLWSGNFVGFIRVK